MTVAELIDLRRSLGLTQSEMGKGMGLALRSYQDIEASDADIKRRHILAAERFALDIAVERRDPMLAPASVRAKALDLAQIIRGE